MIIVDEDTTTIRSATVSYARFVSFMQQVYGTRYDPHRTTSATCSWDNTIELPETHPFPSSNVYDGHDGLNRKQRRARAAEKRRQKRAS